MPCSRALLEVVVIHLPEETDSLSDAKVLHGS